MAGSGTPHPAATRWHRRDRRRGIPSQPAGASPRHAATAAHWPACSSLAAFASAVALTALVVAVARVRGARPPP